MTSRREPCDRAVTDAEIRSGRDDTVAAAGLGSAAGAASPG
ncbi:hypothetical protein [Kribbella catacumbae]|nr:hypothetical protein [Kribbella catacumbae]